MKLGVSMWSYFHTWRKGDFEVDTFIYEAKMAGAEGVELLDFFYNEPNATGSCFSTRSISLRAERPSWLR